MKLIAAPAFRRYVGIDYSGALAPEWSGFLDDFHRHWPTDGDHAYGWAIPGGRSAVVEVYPSLWSRSLAREGRNPEQHRAHTVAAWMRGADSTGTIAELLDPVLTPADRAEPQVEGRILGVK